MIRSIDFNADWYLSLATDADRCGRRSAGRGLRGTAAALVVGDVNWTRTARPGTAAAAAADAWSDAGSPGHSRITAFLTPCRNELGPADGDEVAEAQRLVVVVAPCCCCCTAPRSSVIEVTWPAGASDVTHGRAPSCTRHNLGQCRYDGEKDTRSGLTWELRTPLPTVPTAPRSQL